MSTREQEVPTEQEESRSFLDTEEDSRSQGGDSTDETPGTPSQDQQPVVPSVEFTHPHLKGKSPAEVEALVNLMENTLQSQNRRIEELSSVPREPVHTQSAPEVSGDFFDDPLGHLKRELSAAVAPINQEIEHLKAQAKVDASWSTVAARYDDFEKYRPYVQRMLQAQGVTPGMITPELIESAYFAAVGWVAKNQPEGVTQQEPRQAPPTPTKPQPSSPPQHRPSNAPLPNEGAKRPRQLTEDERRLAREFGMTPQQYLEWGSKDIEDVVRPEANDG